MSDCTLPNNQHNKKTGRYALTGWCGSLLLHGSFAAALVSVAVNMPPTPAVSAVDVSTQETAKQRAEKKEREEAFKQAKLEDQSRRSAMQNSVAKLEEVKRELEKIREQRLRELEQKISSPDVRATPQNNQKQNQTPQPQATPANSSESQNKKPTSEELKKLQGQEKPDSNSQDETKKSESQKKTSETQSQTPESEKLAALPKDQQLRQNARIAPQPDASTQASSQDENNAKNNGETTKNSKANEAANNTDVAKLLDEAAKTEKEIAELDQQIRAAELAKSQNLPMEEALSQTETVLAQRPPLDRSLLQESAVGNSEARAEQNAAKSQISSMLASSQRALSRAKRADGEAGSESKTQSESDETTGLDAQASTRNGEGAPVGTGIEINPELDAQMMPLAQQDGQAAKDLTEATKSDGEPFSGSGSDTKLPSGPSGERTDTTTVRQVIPEISNDIAKEAVAGRRIGPGSKSAKWMYVNSWYTVGPFDNAERKNLHRRFAPENALDLDAAYSGKGGRIVQWKFLQSPEPMIVPDNAEEYAIYYAYTNLWFDEPRDLWIALGSDDHTRMWLNGKLVWISNDSLKGWQAGEGLRRVHFKKGLNRVLVRLENGWQGTAFSLLISLQENPQA